MYLKCKLRFFFTYGIVKRVILRVLFLLTLKTKQHKTKKNRIYYLLGYSRGWRNFQDDSKNMYFNIQGVSEKMISFK